MGLLTSLFGKTDNTELTKALNQGAYIVDVRTPAEYASGSVNGAVNIPLNNVQSQISKFKNKKSVVVFCMSGNRSGQAKAILERNGVQNVINGRTQGNINSAMRG